MNQPCASITFSDDDQLQLPSLLSTPLHGRDYPRRSLHQIETTEMQRHMEMTEMQIIKTEITTEEIYHN